MIGLGLNISKPHTFNRKHVNRSTQKSSYFDGVTDYLVIADHNDFSPTDGSDNDQPFSFACWIKRTDSSSFSLFSKGASSGTLEWRVFAVTNKLYFDIIDNTASVYRRAFASSNFTGFGNWTHVVATYDGNEHQSGLKFYINGEAIALSTTSAGTASWDGIPNTSSEVRFGHMQSASNYDFKGYAADLMYWQRFELTPGHVSYLYGNTGPTENYSIDPTQSANGGLYSIEAAAACIGWWKASADYTITPASSSSSTEYSSVPEVECSGEVVEIEECAAQGVEVGEEQICCAITTVTTTPAVLGLENSVSNNHHATNKGQTNLSSASASNSPTEATIF